MRFRYQNSNTLKPSITSSSAKALDDRVDAAVRLTNDLAVAVDWAEDIEWRGPMLRVELPAPVVDVEVEFMRALEVAVCPKADGANDREEPIECLVDTSDGALFERDFFIEGGGCAMFQKNA